MNKGQFARLERHRKVKKTLAEHADAVEAVPAFAELTEQYLQQLSLLGGTARKKPVTSQGVTLSKGNASTALTDRLVKFANALYLYYKRKGNLEEAAKMHRNPSDYRNMNELERATEAVDLSQRATTLKTELKSYNISAEEVATLATDAASFDDILSAPQLAIDANKIKGATAKATLSGLNIFLKDDFRAGLELLKDTQPETYKALREASQVDDARRGKGKEKKAKAAENELPNTASQPTAPAK